MDFNRILDPLRQKIFMIIGKGILNLVNNSTTDGTQRVQIFSLNNGKISDLDRFQEYGFESYPIAKSGNNFDTEGAQVLVGCIDGNRDQGIVFKVHDRRYRPTNLTEGEVAVYTKLDVVSPHRIRLKDDRSIEITCNVHKIDADSDVDIDSGAKVTIDSSDNTEITSGSKINIDASGAINITSVSGATITDSSGITLNGVTIDANGNIITPGNVTGVTVGGTNLAAVTSMIVAGKEMAGHTHSQGNDSFGNSEQNTSAPV